VNVKMSKDETRRGVILSASFKEPLEDKNIKYKVMLGTSSH